MPTRTRAGPDLAPVLVQHRRTQAAMGNGPCTQRSSGTMSGILTRRVSDCLPLLCAGHLKINRHPESAVTQPVSATESTADSSLKKRQPR